MKVFSCKFSVFSKKKAGVSRVPWPVLGVMILIQGLQHLNPVQGQPGPPTIGTDPWIFEFPEFDPRFTITKPRELRDSYLFRCHRCRGYLGIRFLSLYLRIDTVQFSISLRELFGRKVR